MSQTEHLLYLIVELYSDLIYVQIIVIKYNMENLRNRSRPTLESSSTRIDTSIEDASGDTNRLFDYGISSGKSSTSPYDGKMFYRNNHYSRLYKVIVIGEIGSGKSALIRRYVHNYFSGDSGFNRSTIGVDFSLKILQYTENLEVRLQLWDIAGQERFSSMTRAYYRGTMGAILVFDHSNANSYQAIKRYAFQIEIHR